MKAVSIAVAAVLLVAGWTGTASAGHHSHASTTVTLGHQQSHFLDWDEDTWLDVDDGSVIITHKERGEPRSTVEITEDHELFVDDEQVKLNPEQKILVGQFHDECYEMLDYAKDIGIEGAKIGLEGARLGVEAVACVFKLLSPSYDSDDLEDEMEHKASRIEDRASVLEEKAEVIEDMADDLEDLADDMRDKIPALDDLYWF
jgi:hypothetical protein